MSTELKSSGYAVGSDAYFKNINSKIFIGRFMSSSYDYKDATSRICNNISSALDEIYTDLSKYAKTLRYIDSSDLKDMSTFISGLGYIYSKYGSFGGKASDCISLLNLNSFSTSKNSRASDREIDTAISFMKNNKYLSTSNSVDLINKVLNSGYRSVSTTDTNCNFLLDILGNYDEDFLKDSMLKYNYTQKPSSYTGKNGKQICSKDYILKLEKDIFGDNLGISMFSVSSSAYINLISKSFDDIASRIDSDLNTGERQNDYLTKENAQNLRDCLKALEKVDVRFYGLYSQVDKLDWFIGGKYDSVLTLQKNAEYIKSYE